MLKKLFVHEWKDCWRLVGLMNLIVIGLTLIGTVVMQSDTWSFASENAVIRLTMTLYVMAYIASIAALSLVTVFFFYNRFYKNLYTDPVLQRAAQGRGVSDAYASGYTA